MQELAELVELRFLAVSKLVTPTSALAVAVSNTSETDAISRSGDLQCAVQAIETIRIFLLVKIVHDAVSPSLEFESRDVRILRWFRGRD